MDALPAHDEYQYRRDFWLLVLRKHESERSERKKFFFFGYVHKPLQNRTSSSFSLWTLF